MARPILLAVDDDASVLEAVVQDLRRQYGDTYRVMRAASGRKDSSPVAHAQCADSLAIAVPVGQRASRLVDRPGTGQLKRECASEPAWITRYAVRLRSRIAVRRDSAPSSTALDPGTYDLSVRRRRR